MSAPTTKRQRTTRQPTRNPVHVLICLDKSGSMMFCADQARSAFNEFVTGLSGDGNDYTLSAILFDTEIRPLFSNLKLADVPKLDENNYVPSGTTALYDAIGHLLDSAKLRWGTMKQPYGKPKQRFLCIIQTDGQENSSRRYSQRTIFDKIKHRQDAGNWTFVFLGADQDAWETSQTLGISQGNTLSYDSSASAPTFRHLVQAVSSYSGSGVNATKDIFGIDSGVTTVTVNPTSGSHSNP